jgi:hypothetical protein
MSRGRWGLAVLAVVMLVGAVLLAALPYTLPMGSANADAANQSIYTRCDAAVAQVVSSPGRDRIDVSTDKQPITITVPNLAPCKNVARYRLGAGLLLLTGSLAIGGYLIVEARKESSTSVQHRVPSV